MILALEFDNLNLEKLIDEKHKKTLKCNVFLKNAF
jgi:hypothetical protein